MNNCVCKYKTDNIGSLQTEDLSRPLVVGCTNWSGAGTLSDDSHKCLKIRSRHETCVTCSSETVNDGQFHTVELVTFNRMLNLSVDGGEPTTLDSLGRSQLMKGEAPLYVGGKSRGTSGGKQTTFKVFGVDRICVTAGMPEEVMPASLGGGLSSQTINVSSFHGCIRNLYINHELQDFTRSHMKPGVVPGCQACRRLYCLHGVCQSNAAQVTTQGRTAFLLV